MEDGIEKQSDFWELLGTTADTLASGLRTTGAKGKGAEPVGPAKSGRKDPKGLSIAGATNSGTPYASAGEAKSKAKARIAPARYGNRHVLIVPRCRS